MHGITCLRENRRFTQWERDGYGFPTSSKSTAGLEKAFETYHFRPTYAGANVGHPSYSSWDVLGNRARQDSRSPAVLCRSSHGSRAKTSFGARKNGGTMAGILESGKTASGNSMPRTSVINFRLF
jgi:hypothetical protein